MGLTGKLGSGAVVRQIQTCQVERQSSTHPGTDDCGDVAVYVVTFPDFGTLHVCEACCEEIWERDGEKEATGCVLSATEPD
jgi:hypothetical protein